VLEHMKRHPAETDCASKLVYMTNREGRVSSSKKKSKLLSLHLIAICL
jgi:hypothetical protein